MSIAAKNNVFIKLTEEEHETYKSQTGHPIRCSVEGCEDDEGNPTKAVWRFSGKGSIPYYGWFAMENSCEHHAKLAL